MAANKTIGGINVTISASTEKFAKGINTARKQITAFQKSVAGVQVGLKSFAAGMAGAFTVGAITKFTAAGMEQIGALSDLSVKLGISTEKLAAYQIAAEDSSVSQSTFEKSILKMTKGINDATAGVGTAAKAYKALGLDVEALNRMAPDAQFLAISDALKGMNGQNEKLNTTMAIFGTKGSDMIRFLDLGREGMAKYAEQAKAMGLSIKDDVAASVEEAGDSLARFNRLLTRLQMKGAIAVTPFIKAIEEALDGFQQNEGDLTKYETRKWTRAGQWAVNPLGTGASMLAEFGKTMDWAATATPGRVPKVSFGALDKYNPLSTTGLFKTDDGAALPFTPKTPQQREEEKAKQLLEDLGKLASDMAPVFGELGRLPGKRIGGFRLGDIGKGFDAPWMLQGLMQQGFGGLDGWEGVKKKTQKDIAQRPTLSFAESGTADSYRQQAAIRRQNEDVGKKQLRTQERMATSLDHIEKKLPTFAPANFG